MRVLCVCVRGSVAPKSRQHANKALYVPLLLCHLMMFIALSRHCQSIEVRLCVCACVRVCEKPSVTRCRALLCLY